MPNYNENQNNYGNLNESNENGGFQEFEKRPNGKEKLRLFFNNRRNRAIAAILAVVILASSVCAVVFSKGIGSKKPTLPEETTLLGATAPTSETDSQETKPAETSAPSTETSTEAPTSEKTTAKSEVSSVKPPKSKPAETKPQTTKPQTTKPQTTKPLETKDSQSSHVHDFAPATCISPEKCACGATRGGLSDWHGNNVKGYCAICKEPLFPYPDYFEFYGGDSLNHNGVVANAAAYDFDNLAEYPYGASYVLFDVEITDLSNAVPKEDGTYEFECYVICYDDNYNQLGAYIISHNVSAVGETFSCASPLTPGTWLIEFYAE